MTTTQFYFAIALGALYPLETTQRILGLVILISAVVGVLGVGERCLEEEGRR